MTPPFTAPMIALLVALLAPVAHADPNEAEGDLPHLYQTGQQVRFEVCPQKIDMGGVCWMANHEGLAYDLSEAKAKLASGSVVGVQGRVSMAADRCPGVRLTDVRVTKTAKTC